MNTFIGNIFHVLIGSFFLAYPITAFLNGLIWDLNSFEEFSKPYCSIAAVIFSCWIYLVRVQLFKKDWEDKPKPSFALKYIYAPIIIGLALGLTTYILTGEFFTGGRFALFGSFISIAINKL